MMDTGMANIEIIDKRFKSCVLPNAPLDILGEGFRWLEGPVWFADHQCLLVSDIPNNRIMRWTESGGVSVFREPSHFANGHTRDREGRLIGCSHRDRSIVRTELDGRITVLVDRYQGKRLNSPNDIVVKSDGTIWFSDPTFGIARDYEGGKQASELPPTLYRFDPRDGSLSVVADDFNGPNGLCFSPDESLLYVAESGTPFAQDPQQYIRVFDVADDGARLSNARVFHKVSPGMADGLLRRGRQCLEQRRRWRALYRPIRCVAGQAQGALRRLQPDLRRPRLQPLVHLRLANVVRAIREPARRRTSVSARVSRLLRVGRNVADLQRAQSFYCDALGFTPVDEHDATPAWARLPGVCEFAPRCLRLRLGEQEIELTAFDVPGAPYPAESVASDLWFQHCAVVVDDIQAAYSRLLRHGGATAITRGGPQTLPLSSGGVSAFKFRDPDGHPLELLAFPPGSGDPAWQQRANGPTLGIDHSAISVADADRSIAFYVGLLGLAQTTRQTNRDSQQEKLDALVDDDVEVVALRPADVATPHIELLAYRSRRWRALPRMDLRDIAADRLILRVGDLSALLGKLFNANVETISAGTTGSTDRSRSALLRDPDGHMLVLVE